MIKEEKYTRKIRQKWTRWLKKDLFSEFWYLLKLKEIYEIMSNIFKNAEKYPENNWFYWYVKHTYTDTIISGIYRLIDRRNDIISLSNLLIDVVPAIKLLKGDEHKCKLLKAADLKYGASGQKQIESSCVYLKGIKPNWKLISRRAYTRITRDKYRDEIDYRDKKSELNDEFTKYAGAGEYISPCKVCSDIRRIRKIYKRIEIIRHKFVAHHAYDQRRYRKIPTFLEVNDFVKQLYDIFSKYYLLITGGSVVINIDQDVTEIKEDLAAIFK